MSSSRSSEDLGPVVIKQPLKRMQIPLNKFNEVAIPHHVDLLKKHKSNIEKFQLAGDWDKVHREQVNATRLIKQLKALLTEMDLLRSQVQDTDVCKFDKLTKLSQQTALDAINEYLEMNPQRLSPVWNIPKEEIMDSGTRDMTHEHKLSPVEEMSRLRQITTSISSEELEKQEECLKSWESLQAEAQDVHELYEQFANVVLEQKEDVDQIEENVNMAAENITEGTSTLAKAARYKAAMYPLAGAVLGGCLGGPVGLVAGIKLGGLAALGCGVIGFTGGQLLKKKHQTDEQSNEVELETLNQSRNVIGSISLPHIAGDSQPEAV